MSSGMNIIRWLLHFRARRDGNVSILFGLCAIVVLCIGGLAVDTTRAYTVKVQLGNALDAAALAIGSTTTYPSSVTTDQQKVAYLKTQLKNWFNANYPGNGMATLNNLNFDMTTSTQSVVNVTATATVNTTFMKLLNFDTLTVAATSQITKGTTGLEIALVLDNTGSMAQDNKLSNLKTAASDFVNTMSNIATSSNSTLTNPVRISLVPYTMTVNVGSTYSTATWLDQNGQSSINDLIFAGATNVKRLSLFTQMNTSWAGCVESRPMPYDVQDTAPDTTIPDTLIVPYFAPDEPDTEYNAGSSRRPNMKPEYINNYLTDDTSLGTNWKTLQGDVKKYNKKPISGTNAMGYQYGPNAGCIGQSLMRLTANFSALKTAISNMTAAGDTYIPIGMQWGWFTLSPYGPFADGVDYSNAQVQKVVVLMTDGANNDTCTWSAFPYDQNGATYTGIGYPWENRIATNVPTGCTSQTQTLRTAADNRLLAICSAMKDKGITIYTMTVGDPTDPSSGVDAEAVSVMGQCASSPDKAVNVVNSSDMDAQFQQIANSINQLRLSL